MAVVSEKGVLYSYFPAAKKKLAAAGFELFSSQDGSERWERGEVTCYLYSQGGGKCRVEFEYLD